MGRHRVVTGNEGLGCMIVIAVFLALFVLITILLAVTV